MDILPILQIIGRSDPCYRWGEDLLEISRDHYLIGECRHDAALIEEEWILVEAVLQAHSDFFVPEEFYSKEKFMEVYDQITTRVFDFNRIDTVLVPVGDMFNNSD